MFLDTAHEKIQQFSDKEILQDCCCTIPIMGSRSTVWTTHLWYPSGYLVFYQTIPTQFEIYLNSGAHPKLQAGCSWPVLEDNWPDSIHLNKQHHLVAVPEALLVKNSFRLCSEEGMLWLDCLQDHWYQVF